MANPHSYLIIGAGVFGASTALHLVQAYPSARIILLDRDNYAASMRVAASWDWNKVVRADYVDPLYMELALEAQEAWRSDPLFKDFYHQSGRLWITAKDTAQRMWRNYAALGADTGLGVIGVEEAKSRYGGVFKNAVYDGVTEVLFNDGGGWAEAKEALRATIEKAVALGVTYLEAEVTKLRFDETGACLGAETAAGEMLTANRVILCTGAYTPKLLLDSAPTRQNLHARDRMIAAAVAEGFARVDGVATALSQGPVGVSDITIEEIGGSVGCVPHSKGNFLKYWGAIILRNTIHHEASGQTISAPPPRADYDQLNVPQRVIDDVTSAGRYMYGEQVCNFPVESFRICWEAVTPSEDFIISPHPESSGLYIATCGSFHGWKYLPVLGKYVALMLDGKLEKSLVARWAWDRERPEPGHCRQWPRYELKDL